MLQIQNVCKKYKTGELIQTALDNVSLSLRDNEFVAILGPSGSGKTTLLNVIGGLDRYDSGDLIINGISTKKYKDRDWDSYRNHTIGFVFQSYNLIQHQSVLANVELALTISGVKRAERRRRAKEALEKVGLGNQLHKRPNQMSGGQMQRVAIARALVNDPDILLADEPTGALDTETSVQVMELLKEVAKDRLVVMVTHNPELAEQYATRIVRLRDGKIGDDSAPFTPEVTETAAPVHRNMGKSSMSLLTSLSLSFNNLRTKKGRTLLTSFAGSIGIIGIALILSLSNGVSTYISDIQKDTMASYPISIQAQAMDLSSLMKAGRDSKTDDETITHEKDGIYASGKELEMASSVTTSITENNLTAFKQYLDNPDSAIHQYVGENGIAYSYATKFGVYAYDPEDTLVNTDGSTLSDTAAGISGQATMANGISAGGMAQMSPMASMMTGTSSNQNFSEMLPGKTDASVGKAVIDQYEVLYGNWPKAYNEVVLALDSHNEISAATLYQLGFLPASEYKAMMEKIANGEKITVATKKYSYTELCSRTWYLLPACDTYVKNSNGTFDHIEETDAEMKGLLDKAVALKIVGVVRANDKDSTLIGSSLGYTKALTDYLAKHADESAVVKAQTASKTVNVLNGMTFAPDGDAAKIADAKTYLSGLGVTDKAAVAKGVFQTAYADNPMMATQLMAKSETELAAMLDEYLKNPKDEVMLSLYKAYVSPGTYDDNLDTFGVVSADAPAAIQIYSDSFADKDKIAQCITDYNAGVSKENKITYTDYVALLMSSVTTIIDVISYVLIAFVAVSLVVSSIMIGIITYISVLERTKEIGILRAIGASKHNISQVFNAETFIIGLCAGLIGIGISLLLLIPGNMLIHSLTGSTAVNAALPPVSAVILIVLSMLLTLIGGFIPAKKAAKKDPVTALRTE